MSEQTFNQICNNAALIVDEKIGQTAGFLYQLSFHIQTLARHILAKNAFCTTEQAQALIHSLNEQNQLAKYLEPNKFYNSELPKHLSFQDYKQAALAHALEHIDMSQVSLDLQQFTLHGEQGYHFTLKFDWQGGIAAFASELCCTDGKVALDDGCTVVSFGNDCVHINWLIEPIKNEPSLTFDAMCLEIFNDATSKLSIQSNALQAEFNHASPLDQLEACPADSAMMLLINAYLDASYQDNAQDFFPCSALIADYLAGESTQHKVNNIDESYFKKGQGDDVDKWIEYFSKLDRTIDAMFLANVDAPIQDHPDGQQYRKNAKVKEAFCKQALTANRAMDNPIALHALIQAINVDVFNHQGGQSRTRYTSILSKYNLWRKVALSATTLMRCWHQTTRYN
ncbi:hypothetical protein [Shewanella aestuarii]|uniref:Uncharacterized protein n=1 Tax=Shewanella aestuarii TaxID=1028752 RepID=A0A6G9QRA8_9GAMM|nr:hypothetical protein [Shewanella aestuarii]QIR16567.1 hypothetical protein HBH39_19015 [Shewanella aestuarii]